MRPSRPTQAGQPRGPQGVALIIVLLMLTILSVLTVEFLSEVRIQTIVVHNHESRIKARYVARAGKNAGEGLIKITNPENEMFNNAMIQLFRYKCYSSPLSTGLGLTTEPEREKPETEPDAAEPETDETPDTMDGCGAWSLGIPYALEDTWVDLEISDEQAKINVNALAQVSTENEEGEAVMTRNMLVHYMLYELFVYEIVKHEIDMSDFEVARMLDQLWDYMDHGMVDQGFDSDGLNYFEYEDRIIPMKNGYLDTIEELRYLPDMNDELFDAVKDFLTVYPMAANNRFEYKINVNAAPVEVLYAVIRVGSYDLLAGEPTIAPETALQYATQMVQTAHEGQTQSAGSATGLEAALAAGTDISVPIYKREWPAELSSTPNLNNLKLSQLSYPRFFTITSSAEMEDGISTTILEVVKIDTSKKIETLYYKEL